MKLVYDYKSDDGSRETPVDAKEYQEKDNPFTQAEKKKEQDERTKKLLDEFFKSLFELIIEAEQAAKHGNWEKVERIIATIKNQVQTIITSNNPDQIKEVFERVNKLEQRLLTQTINSSPKSYQPLIISLIIIFPIVLGMTYWFAGKWVKHDFRKQINQLSKKNRIVCKK